MGSLALVKHQGGVLAPLTEIDKQNIDKRKVGSVLQCDYKVVRNPQFHRKYFALLQLGFDYWTPAGGTVSKSEKSLLRRFVEYLGYYGAETATLMDYANGFEDALKQSRANVEIEKSFDAFRKWVAVEAGYYSVVELPNGTVRKEAKSISYAKMDDDEFSELYKASLNVLWNYILNHNFNTIEEADQAVNQLLSYL